MKILICGAGKVGLALGKCLKLADHDVDFHEISPSRMYELQLDGWKISDKTNYANGLVDLNRDAVFITVHTQTKTGEQDLTAVKNVVETLSKIKNNKEPRYLFMGSTVLPGTMRNVVYPLMKKSGYILVSNPEFMTEADPINTILGGPLIFGFDKDYDNHIRFIEFFTDLFQHPLFKQDYYFTTWETAELIKYTNNFLLASRISAWNQIKLVADKIKVNSHSIAGILSQESTIGEYGSHHGKAFGLSCLPKDIEAFNGLAKKFNIPRDMIQATVGINEYMKNKFGVNESKYVW